MQIDVTAALLTTKVTSVRRQLHQDDENKITKVFAISRDQWADLNRLLLDKQI